MAPAASAEHSDQSRREFPETCFDAAASSLVKRNSNHMIQARSLAVALLVSSALVAFGGEAEVSSKTTVAPAPPPAALYGNRELQFDLFGAYAPSGPGQGRSLGDHAWGGGSALNYFFTRNFGLGLGGEALDGTDGRSGHVSGDFALSGFARYPIGATAWAPYALGAIGGFVTGGHHYRGGDEVLFEGRVGLGLEYRFSRHLGAFSDGGYTFVAGRREDFGLIRTGLRLSF